MTERTRKILDAIAFIVTLPLKLLTDPHGIGLQEEMDRREEAKRPPRRLRKRGE